jgi:hypothetical protein
MSAAILCCVAAHGQERLDLVYHGGGLDVPVDLWSESWFHLMIYRICKYFILILECTAGAVLSSCRSAVLAAIRAGDGAPTVRFFAMFGLTAALGYGDKPGPANAILGSFHP